MARLDLSPPAPLKAAKSAAESAEKPAIIVGRPWCRNRALTSAPRCPHMAPRSGLKVSGSFLIDRMAVRVVIDTQTLLDWQFFRNPICLDWSLPGPAGGWDWLVTAEMRDELAHVLARGFAERWTAPVQPVLDFFDRHALIQPSVAVKPADVRGLRCTDPDDQKFIDLAIVARAAMLVTRDKALLRLRKAAWMRHRVAIIQPGDWRR